MTSYNRELFIAEAIDSVLALHYANFELIIVDDCSTDSTVSIAQKYVDVDERICLYINDQNLGDYFNRNKAASYASGKYLKYLDSDDKIYPYSLNIMVDAMELNQNVALGLSFMKIQDDLSSFPILMQPTEAYYHHFLNGGLLFSGPSGAIIRTDSFMQAGGFSGKRFISDTELWLKLAQQIPVIILQPSLIWWRRHQEQEFNLGHVNEDYVILNYELNRAFLETENCPLKKSDQSLAIRNYKNRFGRKVIKKMFRLDFKNAVAMTRKSGISILDILISAVPINKLRNLFK